MKSITLIQAQQREWQRRHFPDTDSTQVLLGVTEEVGELCHAHLKGQQGIRHAPEKVRDMKMDAVGDVVIYLMAYCNLEGFDLHEIVDSTWTNVVQKRDWRADPMDAGDSDE